MNKREAGQKGAETYRARGELKREVKAGGSKRVCELLYEPDLPEFVQKMPLHELLAAVPFLTPPVYEPMLEGVPIKLTALCSDPTYRKRRELIKRLEAWDASRRVPSGQRARKARRVPGATARLLAGSDGKAAR